MKKKLLFISLMLAIAGIMHAGNNHNFYIGGRWIKHGEVLTPQNFGSVIKAGTVTYDALDFWGPVLKLDNAVIEYGGPDPALAYWSDTRYSMKKVQWGGRWDCDFIITMPNSGRLYIKGKCSITHTGNSYGIEVRSNDTALEDMAILDLSGVNNDAELTVRSNHSNAIYLHGRKFFYPRVLREETNEAGIEFGNIYLKLYAPNGCAIRGRQNTEFIQLHEESIVHIPEPCKDGTLIQCLHLRSRDNKKVDSWSYGTRLFGIYRDNYDNTEVQKGSLVNRSNGSKYTGPLILAHKLPEIKLSDNNLLMLEGESRKVKINVTPKSARQFVSFKMLPGMFVEESIEGHTVNLKAKNFSSNTSLIETTFLGKRINELDQLLKVDVTVPLYIANKLIPPAHCSDIGAYIPYTYSWGGVSRGKLSYNRGTNTLTMDNVTLDGYRNSLKHALTAEMPLTIYLKGNNIIKDTSRDPLINFKENTLIKGDNGAKLTTQLGIPSIRFNKSLTIEKGVTLDLNGGWDVLVGSDKPSTLKVAGKLVARSDERCPISSIGNMVLDGTAITTPAGGFFNGLAMQYADGKEMFNGQVVIEPVAQTVPVSDIKILPSSITVEEGDMVNLSHTVLPANATNKNVTWSSSNEELAVVNSFGRVWARKAPANVNEKVLIRVKSSGSFADDCYVTITSPTQEKPYDLFIAGTQVTSHNASKITGTGISGSVSYNHDTKTLTLNGATITAPSRVNGIKSYTKGLTIRLIGTNRVNTVTQAGDVYFAAISLTSDNVITGGASDRLIAGSAQSGTGILYNEDLIITGGCQVTAEGKFTGLGVPTGMTGGKLTINNSILKAKGAETASIRASSRQELKSVGVTQPAGAYFSSSTVKSVDGNDEKGWVVIEPVEYYGITIAGHDIHSGNASNFKFRGLQGTINYDASRDILTLDEVYFDPYDKIGILSSKNLRIHLLNMCHIVGSPESYAVAAPGIRIHGENEEARLKAYGGILTLSHLTITGGAGVEPYGGKYGVSGLTGASEELTIDNSFLHADGTVTSIARFKKVNLIDTELSGPWGVTFDQENIRFKDNAGNPYTGYVTFSRIPQYDLWVGSKQVNRNNKADILGDGTASYDSDKKLLKLKDANINIAEDDAEAVAPVKSGIEGLTVLLHGENALIGASYMDGIALMGAGSTIQGPGSLYAEGGHESVGLRYSKNFTIKDCAVTVRGEEGGIRGDNGGMRILNSTVSAACDDSGYSGSMSGISSLEMKGCGFLAPQDVTLELRNGFNGVTTDEGRTYTTEEVIIGTADYGVYIDERVITPFNAGEVTGENVTGHISFNPGTNTLRLDNARVFTEDIALMTMREESGTPLTIELIGNNYLENPLNGHYVAFFDSPITITGSGTLNIKTQGRYALSTSFIPITITGGCTVIAEGAEYGLTGVAGAKNEILTIDGATVRVKGGKASLGSYKSMILKGVNITSPSGAVFNSNTGNIELNGKAVTDWVEIGPVSTGVPVVTPSSNDGGSIHVRGGKGTIHITVSDMYVSSDVRIYNLSGSLVRTAVIGSGGIHTAHVPAGIYIVRVGAAAEKVIVK